MRVRRLLFLSAGHMISDLYGGMLPPLLPVILLKYNLSMAKAGILIFVLHACANLSQPIVGILNDHRPLNALLWIGPLFSALSLAFILSQHNIALLILALVCAGVGIGMYHPVSASIAGKISKQHRQGFSMAIYSAGGSLGVIIAPLAIVFIVETLGETLMPLIIIPALLMTILAKSNIDLEPRNKQFDTFREWWQALQSAGKPLMLLWLISSARAVTYLLLGSFLPVLAMSRGMSFSQSAYFLSIVLFAGMVGMFIGGHLSDIWGARTVLSTSLFLSVPFIAGFLYTEGIVSILLLLPGMSILTSTIPVNILLAQDAAPRHTSVASSLIMGFSFLVGALFAPLFGSLADVIGIEHAMRFIVLIPVIGGGVALLVPKSK